MRPFCPRPAVTGPDDHRLAQCLTGSNINLVLDDMGIIIRTLLGSHIDLAVLIEHQRWVNAPIRNDNRIRPGSCRICSGHIKVAPAPHIRSNHVEGSLMVTDGRRINPVRAGAAADVQLADPVQYMADLLPVD
ncbi:hypothetical protein D3C81_1662480 [compost metagenome]